MNISNFQVAHNCDKLHSENWNSVFSAGLDRAPTTHECKMLQLCQYFCGDAMKVEGLGHSGYAYQAAKGHVERKYERQH